MCINRVPIIYQNLKLKYKLIFLFSIVSLVTLAVFSSVSITVYKKLIIKNESHAMLENLDIFKVNLNNYIENVENFSTAAILSKDIQDNIGQNLDTIESEKRLQIFNNVYNRIHEVSNNTIGIRSIYIIGKHNNMFSIDTFANIASPYIKEGELNEQDWYQQAVKLGGAPYWTILDWYNGERLIAMARAIKNINNMYENSNIGVCLITISPSLLENYLSRNRINEGNYLIIDKNNEIYTNSANSFIKDSMNLDLMNKGEGYYIKNEHMVTYSHNPLTNWTYAHVIDRDFLLKDVRYINQVWLFVTILSFIMVVFISIFISNSVSNPLKKLVTLIKEVEKGDLRVEFNNLYDDEIGVLGGSFNKMVEKIRQGIPIKREKFFRSLLVDNLTEEEYEEFKRDVDVSFVNDDYQVVIIVLGCEISEDLNKQIERKIAKYEDLRYNIISMTLKNGEYCIISNRNEEGTYEVIKEILADIKASFNINADAFSGNNYNSLHFIKNSYEEARDLVRYKFFNAAGFGCINHEFIVSNSWAVTYPESLENRLFYCIEQSDIDGCKMIIEESIQFFKENNTDPSIICTFIFNIYMRLFKSTVKKGKLPADIFGKNFWNVESLQYIAQSIENELNDLVRTIKEYITLIESPFNENINTSIKKAIEIIDEEYGSPLLGAEYLAGKVYLNENYFCRLFKKELGISFVDYVSSIRVEKAKELLKNSSIKIKDISSNVGFSDPHYFGIWFKENTGITPSQYRKQ